MMQKPGSIQFGVTNRCNLRCLHCDIWKRKKAQELSLKEWKNIIVALKSWLGNFRLDISGGEPFIREDLLELIGFCADSGITVAVTTNSTLLDGASIDRLSEMKNLVLNISLDGFLEKTHDHLRGKQGVYRKAREVLGEFRTRDKKCRITLATILMGYNIYEIINLVKLVIVDGLADGINFQALDYNFGANYDGGWRAKSPLWPSKNSKDYLIAVLDELVFLKKNNVSVFNSFGQLEQFKNYFFQDGKISGAICNAGERNFIVNPSGEALLCWNMAPVGDAKNEDPEKIWNSALAGQRRDEIRKCQMSCRILNCNFSE